MSKHCVFRQVRRTPGTVATSSLIRVRNRDQLKTNLAQQGIPSEIYYPHPLHLQPAFANLGHRPGSMPESEAACREVLSLPIYPVLTGQRLQLVVNSIAEFNIGVAFG